MHTISFDTIDGAGFDARALECLGEVINGLRSRALSASRAADSLWYAKLFGEILTANFTGCFSDDDLERALYKKWIEHADIQPADDRRPNILFVASALYDTGGHTRLLRMLTTECARRHITFDILLTGRTREETQRAFHTSSGGVQQLGGTLADKSHAIISAGLGASSVVFLHHPFDVAAALAARKLTDLGRTTLLINHSDHTFGFGHGAVGAVCEICAVGWRTTADHRVARAQSFLGIPVADTGNAPPEMIGDRYGPIVSVGDPSKFVPYGELDFPKFAERILEKLPNDMEIVGPNASDPIWQRVAERFPERIRLRGLLPFQELTQLLGKASCYVDSFPLDGGTIFPQALVGGLTVFGANRRSAPGVSFADSLRYETLDDMELAMIRYLRGEEEIPDQVVVRSKIIDQFNSAIILDRLLAASEGELAPLPDEFARAERDSLYNMRRWEKAGRIMPPKATWRDGSTALRIRFAFSMMAARGAGRCALRKRMILNSLFRY